MNIFTSSGHGLVLGRLRIGLFPTNEKTRWMLASMDSDPARFFSQRKWAIYWSSWLSWKFLAQGSYRVDKEWSSNGCKKRSIYPGGRPGGHMGFYVCIPLLGSFSFSRQQLVARIVPQTEFQVESWTDMLGYSQGLRGRATIKFFVTPEGKWGINPAVGWSKEPLVVFGALDQILFKLNWVSIMQLARKYEGKVSYQLIEWSNITQVPSK